MSHEIYDKIITKNEFYLLEYVCAKELLTQVEYAQQCQVTIPMTKLASSIISRALNYYITHCDRVIQDATENEV